MENMMKSVYIGAIRAILTTYQPNFTNVHPKKLAPFLIFKYSLNKKLLIQKIWRLFNFYSGKSFPLVFIGIFELLVSR